MPAVSLAVAVLATVVSWRVIDSGPPGATAPRAAIDFVRRAGISGNVFNSYSFGGYLIFLGIPTFIDGRIPPYADNFVRKYFEAVDLVSSKDAFQMLDDYKIKWIILKPTERLTQALTENPMWHKVFSDNDAVIFVPHQPAS